MELLASEHIMRPECHMDIALVRYPMGEYRVLVNTTWHMRHRSSGYLRTTGFADNRDRAAWNCYHREVRWAQQSIVPPWYEQYMEKTA